LSYSRKIALRYLWSKRSEAFITILTIISLIGVAIGVAVICIVMSIMTGFEHELREKLVGTNSHIVVRRLGGKIEGWQELSKKLEKVEGVSSVSAFTYHQALVRADDRSSGILIKGIEPGSYAATQLKTYLDNAGDGGTDAFAPVPFNAMDSEAEVKAGFLPALVVGKELTRTLNVFIGQPVSLISPSVTSTPYGLIPRYKRFAIGAVYKSGLAEYENGLAYMLLSEAQSFFRMGDAVSGFEIRVNNIDQSSKVTQTLTNELSALGAGYYAQDWTESNRPLWEAIQLEKKVYFIVLLLIIVMASFSIISMLVMIVLEKRKDIAILKTMGATRKEIANIFRYQGAIIGLLGTLLGLLGGYVGCVALDRYGFPLDERIFPVSQVPVQMEALNFISVAVAAFMICFIATIYPARKASKLQPSEVLRYE
jgi:lipoprotein-releasing system permease protein